MPFQNKANSFLPTCSIDNLRRRAKLLKKIRRFFDDLDFVEVETPLISTDIVVDQHIHPVEITTLQNRTDSEPSARWLQTSPEFAMKRLLAAGADKIFQICKAFRNSERGPQHNPEFTMLEWYRSGDSYEQGRELLAHFACTLFDCKTVEQVSYRQAFENILDHCPLRSSDKTLLELARKHTQVNFTGSEPRDEFLNALLSECVEPQLGRQSPVIIYDFPAGQAALAKIRNDDPPVAERYELYFRGVELANGYHELTDAEELLMRNERVNQLRKKDNLPELPVHSRLLEAMRKGIPDCCGVAVGVDRLAMLLLNSDRIDEVIPFPIEIA